MGLDMTPSPHTKNSLSVSSVQHIRTPQKSNLPPTPIVVPPTPSSGMSGPSTGRPRSPSNASSSSLERFAGVTDDDLQTKRRSLLRSPGTASSPDLATLVRKAREKSRLDGSQHQVEQNGNNPDTLQVDRLTPNAASHEDGQSRTRQRSSTTVSPRKFLSSKVSKPNLKSKSPKNTKGFTDDRSRPESPTSSEWIMPSPRPRADTLTGKGKSSVRSKTSAFLGKIIGQGSFRDKRTEPLSPSTSSRYNTSTFRPPVPPLPKEHRANTQSDTAAVRPSISDLSKPLPPIQTDHLEDRISDDDRSMIIVESTTQVFSQRASSPEKTIKDSSSAAADGRTRRRSISVGERGKNATFSALSKGKSSAAAEQSRPSVEWDAQLNGIMSDFKGTLSQLDPVTATLLDLKDPSTPQKSKDMRLKRPKTDSGVPQSAKSRISDRPKLRDLATAPANNHGLGLSLSPLATGTMSTEEPLSPLSPDFDSPIESPTTISQFQFSNVTTNQTKSLSLDATLLPRSERAIRPSSANPAVRSSQDVYRPPVGQDSSRLRVQHRSNASSSEPSLLMSYNAEAEKTVRLIPSSGSIGWPDSTSPRLSLYLNGSQNDLTPDDLALTRFSISSGPKSGDSNGVDMDKKAKDLALRCWNEDELFLSKEKIAEWLGRSGQLNREALHHYMNNFDFSGLRVDIAFRRLCTKLFLKAETQQVDRILEEFSKRYWKNNSETVYGNASVVHAVAYSLLLLNTDLHVAKLSQKMSRNQFVRNTLSAIEIQQRTYSGAERSSTPELMPDDDSSMRAVGMEGNEMAGSTIRSRPTRSGSVVSWTSAGKETEPRVRTSSLNSDGFSKNFQNEMENLLKEMYNAIKSQQILQPSAANSSASLSPGSSNPNLLRNRSYRGQNDRLANLKRGSMRGIQTLFTPQSGASPYSSNSSIDGRISPSPSFATSTHDGYTGSSSSFLTPTLGFASNLSHTIIKEAQEDDYNSVHSDNSISSDVSITSEELSLLGAPWAKEGSLCRKQYWESVGKRAKSKNWLDVFVVISKGDLSMFTFGETTSGQTQDIGGGNWLSNANLVGTVSLSHSLAHALPPPGYNRQRPYCFVLTLASGGVYFFQAGTEELVNEWVSTCNYWAARQSKEPLAGGVSNMEYGWNRVLTDSTDSSASLSQEGYDARDTDQSETMSMRSGRSRLSKKDVAFSSRRGLSPYSDRVLIHEWKPPIASSVPSGHDEESQLEALQKHIANLNTDLSVHNNLRMPMMQLYPTRSSNANKALANWERKSQYLLTEIVKYESYVESLKTAMNLRLKIRGEKALEKALVGVESDNGSPMKNRWRGHPEEATIPEGEEPPPTPGYSVHHRREQATAGGGDN